MTQKNKKGARNNTNTNRAKTPRKKNAAANMNTAGRKTKNNHSGAGKSNETIKTAGQNKRGEPAIAENSLALSIAPFVLLILALYLLVSFFIYDAQDVGIAGVFSRNIFYGILGSVAVLIPFFMGSIAIFLKKDKKSGFFKYRIIFSVICLVLYASMFHLPSKEIVGGKYLYSGISEILENGANSIGGGILGGYFAETLLKIVGPIGAWIFTVPLSVVFSIFLFGYTPVDLIRYIYKLIIDYKESKKELDGEIKAKPALLKRRLDLPRAINAINASNPASGGIKESGEQANSGNSRDFQVDIPIDSRKDRKKAKKGEIDISDNPFANSFSEEVENMNAENQKNQELRISYETPVMLPDNELFDSGKKPDLTNKTEKGQAGEEVDGLFADFDADANEVGEIKIVESAPQARDDEPDMVENTGNKKKGKKPIDIDFETSKIFEEDDKPARKEYKLPPISYLTKDTSTANVDIKEELQTTAQKIIDTLKSFGVKTKIYDVSRGPTITRYEIAPDSGTKVNSIVNLVNDISLNLAAEVRIEAPIPGKAAIGIEVPNKVAEIVHLRTLLEDQRFTNAESKITIALGQDVAGNSIYSDIAKMPHLLIAGATNSGKSICINSIITSILYKATPDDVKLILIDPKKVELNPYNGIPHLLVPVVSDHKKAAGALAWAINEMENRYILIEEKGARNFKGYNDAIAGDPFAEPLPQIVIIIDELADLMLTAKVEVEQSVNRLAAKARAAGIHLIVATQRPSVDVITGLIKANIPTRISFTVVSPQDSRTIIDMGGADKLIGRGDMLYVPIGSKPRRVQGAYIDDNEVLNVVEFWKKQSDGAYDENVMNEIEQEAARCGIKGGKNKDMPETGDDEELDKEPRLKEAIEIAVDRGEISTSMLQTRLSLGYNRAARIINTMEQMNIIGPFAGSKPRKVLISREQFIEMTMKNGDF